ncbi:MAG: YhbY family RNA-binding protein [ANME-2 cluster archaeon]|nr:YhbY family RNA-binding protein [ANME-2 cluster archaeon]MBC2701910.1 YhbY family RNA-binding protein [ANME-2 cluster archaeon]MBC2707830.1 YhbY family RNA-binding protein [ANME-2 cluster archaeon]MBC2747861.1 YhbY family RNA-binding protein [ANME-2 cluster archaeon]MBC2762386.1 YhbY family RNA-binding protein [ANME-2 cluster archaeon]
MDIYKLKHDAAHLTPLLNIGKNGVTDSLIEELLRQLKQNKLVKVKILKSALGDMDRKAIAEELAKRTGSQLIEIRGSSAVLYRK